MTFAASNPVGNNLPYGDTYHTDDMNLITNNNALKHSTGTIWLAARHIVSQSNYTNFYVYSINPDSSINGGNGLYDINSNSASHIVSYVRGVRPVITLRGDLEITGGSGTQGSPYTLGVKERRVPETGSYITYTGGDYTGDWVVLRNKDGQLEIISKESVGDVTLSGAEGYANAVSILNNKAQQYLNANYAVGARSVGATEDSIGQINTTQYPLTFAAAREQGVLPYSDTYTTYDQGIIEKSTALQHTSGNVWLASRYMHAYAPSTSSKFGVKYFGPAGNASGLYLFVANSDSSTSSNTYSLGVRPVITLRPDMEIIGGSGLQSDPYRIGVPKEKVTVGSYVQYSAGDYAGDWVVLRNTKGQLEIISKESVGNVTISGAKGYANAVNILNTKAREYINTNYAVNGRSVGATENSIGAINTTEYPLTYAAASATTEHVPYFDICYISDQQIIANNATLQHSSGWVWMASRILTATDSLSDFKVRRLNSNGYADGNYVYQVGSGGGTNIYSDALGVRPVVTLRSDIQIIGGSGTVDTPYILGVR